MSSIWNILSPLRTGFVKLAPAGKELYGTVIKHGKMEKTCTVRVDFQYWNNKYQNYFHSSSKFLAHDETNFCISGDKVVIRACRPASHRKHYYVRNIVKAFPRQIFYKPPPEKKDPRLEEEFKKVLEHLYKTEVEGRYRGKKQPNHLFRKALKTKALNKAMQNIKKLEKLEALKALADEKLQSLQTESQAETQQETNPTS